MKHAALNATAYVPLNNARKAFHFFRLDLTFIFFLSLCMQYSLGAIFQAIQEYRLQQSMKNSEEMVMAASMEL